MALNTKYTIEERKIVYMIHNVVKAQKYHRKRWLELDIRKGILERELELKKEYKIVLRGRGKKNGNVCGDEGTFC